jgi:hypothetical protein
MKCSLAKTENEEENISGNEEEEILWKTLKRKSSKRSTKTEANAKINKFFMKYRRGETQCEMKAAKDTHR